MTIESASSAPAPDTKTVTTEGAHVAEALAKAAELLGVPASQVAHKLDLTHFKNELGRARPVDTVKIIAWATDPAETAGAEAAREWLAGLVERMGLEASIKVVVSQPKVAELKVDSPDARHLVGRQGSTLASIQTLLEEAVGKEQEGWRFRIDVGDGRDEHRDRDDRRGRDRDDRGERGRGRDRDDRGERGRGRDRDDRGGRGRDRDRRPRRSDAEIDELRKLAVRIAHKVRDTGEADTIRRELNSFERRIVHVAISEIDGVDSESVGDGPTKSVRIFSDAGGSSEE